MKTEGLILYGAGKKGRAYLDFLRHYEMDSYVFGFCDNNADKIGEIEGKPVYTYDKAKEMGLPFLLSVRQEYKPEIIDKLLKDRKKFYENLDNFVVDELHIMPRTAYEREICAIAHIDTMDEYFAKAEEESALSIFWEDGGLFRDMFSRLNLDNVVELACGRGRHVPHYIENAGHITLVDILEKNIEYCKNRFKYTDKISYFQNNGHDLHGLADNSYTSLFTYDSMVHFELLDIADYLQETYRILQHGGRALFHHSNNDSDYKASYDDAVEARSFMNHKIFAYLAYRAGFEIEEQKEFDWVGTKLDCLTLVIKR